MINISSVSRLERDVRLSLTDEGVLKYLYRCTSFSDCIKFSAYAF